MDFFRRLFGGNGAQTADPDAIHLYVRCGHCGAPIHVRVDMRNDLSAEYGDDLIEGYHLIKEMMDSTCFRLLRAEIRFDRNRRELDRKIEGGEFIARDEYDRYRKTE